ncbi:MAG: hypothetical protein OXE79_08775 [Acidimicrobiaceae bacterium]|nr:hypothetical protein [Acidimicrobiaceae bacterium]MCY4175613.1 hypothetical protein [Acidimicrobiaceae bacterium]MCY4279341.1 hypothetical protein [Acidimicrobiaceae bacterium]MCY4294984.1 hypothetical protein [Acidimicrobiaceae bacterium]
MENLMHMSSLDYGIAARSLARAARLRGLLAPVYASPPSRPDLDRSIRRRNGSPVVSIRLRGRPRAAVLADMIEGIVVSNSLEAPRADLVRSALWLAVDGAPDDAEQAPPSSPPAEPVSLRPPNAVAA